MALTMLQYRRWFFHYAFFSTFLPFDLHPIRQPISGEQVHLFATSKSYLSRTLIPDGNSSQANGLGAQVITPTLLLAISMAEVI